MNFFYFLHLFFDNFLTMIDYAMDRMLPSGELVESSNAYTDCSEQNRDRSDDNFLVQMNQQLENSTNQLSILSNISEQISVEVHTPISPVNTESRLFSIMFHQNLFIRNLDTASVHQNSTSNFLFRVSEMARAEDSGVRRFYDMGFLGSLTRFDIFLEILENIEATSSLRPDDQLLEEEKILYGELSTILKKYEYIYERNLRFSFFKKIINLSDKQQRISEINRWTEGYIGMVQELKEFKKKVPSLYVYDSQDLEARRNFLREQISHMENSVSNLRKEFENMSDLFNSDDN